MRIDEKTERTMQPQYRQLPAKPDGKPQDARKAPEATFRFTDWASI